MSIEEKQITIAQNVPKVFTAGYEKGKAEVIPAKPEQEKTIEITKNGTTEVLPDENKVLSKVNVEVNVQAKSVDYMPYLTGQIKFASDISEITDDIYLDLSNATNLYGMFHKIQLNCSKITVKISNKCVTFWGAFWGAGNDLLRTIEIIGETSNVTDFGSTFRDRRLLECILGELDFSSATICNDWLINTNRIKEIRFKPNTIKISIHFINLYDLTDESIQSIVGGLADLTGQESQTVTFHADVKAKLMDEQISTITSKNWTLA